MSHEPTGLTSVDYSVALAMNLLWGFNIIAMKGCVIATADFLACGEPLE